MLAFLFVGRKAVLNEIFREIGENVVQGGCLLLDQKRIWTGYLLFKKLNTTVEQSLPNIKKPKKSKTKNVLLTGLCHCFPYLHIPVISQNKNKYKYECQNPGTSYYSKTRSGESDFIERGPVAGWNSWRRCLKMFDRLFSAKNFGKQFQSYKHK